ncbi:hypothetical protein NHF40_13580 [Maricaulaceae bacterium EIL42A08]|nr:hypothetical protein [Maricaulaceae bacterium EIL42A08]
MFEIALSALSLTLAQEEEADPWIQVDGEWQRTFTCTVDDTGYLRMDDRDRAPNPSMNAGDTFQLTVRDDDNYEDNQLLGIILTPPEDLDAPPETTESCTLGEDGMMFRCTASLRPNRIIDWYGSLEEHRFNVVWVRSAIGMATSWGSDPSDMVIETASGVCLD